MNGCSLFPQLRTGTQVHPINYSTNKPGHEDAYAHRVPEKAAALVAIGARHPWQQVIQAVLFFFFVFASKHGRCCAKAASQQLSCCVCKGENEAQGRSRRSCGFGSASGGRCDKTQTEFQIDPLSGADAITKGPISPASV